MKNNKGFTMMELMIVIAIIGILAVVLLPKVGEMKTEVKLEGLTTNMRVAEAMATKLIVDYSANATDAEKLELAVLGRLADVKNPITDNEGGAVTVNTTNGVVTGIGALFHATDDATDAPLLALTAGNADLAGMIGITAYVDAGNNNKLTVKLIPFNDKGTKMEDVKHKKIVK